MFNDINENQYFTQMVKALKTQSTRHIQMDLKLTESQERIDELENALRESVMVAIDRDLEVNAARLGSEEKVIAATFLKKI